MKPDNRTGGPWLCALGLTPVIWLALLTAPSIFGGLAEIMNGLPVAMKNLFKLV